MTDSPRDLLLDKALAYYATHGVRDTSLRTLAAAIGTSQRMLHYHFGAREDLLAAVIARLVERDTARVQRLASEPGDPFEAGRRNWRDVSAEAMVFGPLFFELATHAMHHEPYAAELAEALVPRTEAAFAAAYAEYVEAGQAARLARLAVAVGRGLMFEALIDEDLAASDAAMEEFVAMVRWRLADSAAPPERETAHRRRATRRSSQTGSSAS